MDKEFNDDDSPGVIDEITDDGDMKYQSNLKLGLLVGILGTLLVEFIMGTFLDTQGNLVHRYVAYMLGIALIFIAAVLSKSTFKMFIIGTPTIITTSFILPYFLPDYFSGLMAPFLNLFPIAKRITDSTLISGAIDPATQGYIDLVFNYGIIFDFLVAMLVGTLASLGISGILKILKGKVNILTIFTISFTLLFFLLGVILLPYVLVIFSGATQFAMTFGVGGLALTEGMTEIGKEDGDLNLANAYFAEAKDWFIQAENMLDGMEDLYLFALIGKGRPTLQPIIDNGLLAISAGIDLAQGVGPLLAGVGKIQSGITNAMSVFDTQNSALSMSGLSDADLTKFNEGLAEMEEGFENVTASIADIKNALNKIVEIDEDEFNAALQSETGSDLSNELGLIDDAATLFNATLDVLEILIADPEGAVRAPFIHLILGALALNEASSAVGGDTSFQGTGRSFENVVGNLTYVVDTFDDPVFASFDAIKLEDGSDLIEVKNQITGMFEFIKDAGNIAIGVGNFGILVPPTLETMNSSISIYTDPRYDNFTVIPESVYDEKILALDGVIVDTKTLVSQGTSVDSLVNGMSEKSKNGSYGMMDSAASEFNSVFSGFNLTENALNFYHIASGFQATMKSTKNLGKVDTYMQNISNNMNLIKPAVDALDNDTAFKAVNNVDGNLTLADGLLNETLYSISLASGNFSLVTNMPQLADTAASLDNIATHIVNIQGRTLNPIDGIAKIRDLTSDELAFVEAVYIDTSDTGPLGEIQNALDFIDSEFAAIQGELDNIEMAS